jgi:hypothetical protein
MPELIVANADRRIRRRLSNQAVIAEPEAAA